jgi:hypothetical protein
LDEEPPFVGSKFPFSLLVAAGPNANRIAAVTRQLFSPIFEVPLLRYLASCAARCASISLALSASVKTGGSTEIVNLSILPVKAKGI